MTGAHRPVAGDQMAAQWYASTMRATIDAVNGGLEVRVPSRVRVADGPHGLHFVADDADELSDEHVRGLIEKSRR